MDCPSTNEDVQKRIERRIRDGNSIVFYEELDRVVKLLTKAESSLTKLKEEKKVILALRLKYTGDSERDPFALSPSVLHMLSTSEFTTRTNIGPEADGLESLGRSGDQVLGGSRPLTSPAVASATTPIKDPQIQTSSTTTNDASRGTTRPQGDPAVGGSGDTNRWHLPEDIARIQSSKLLSDEFVFALRGSPSTAQYVLRCPDTCDKAKVPYMADGIFTKPLYRGRALKHFLAFHSDQFPPDLEADEAQRFIVTHFAKKVEWDTDQNRPEGGVLQKFEEWKISSRAPEPRIKKIRIAEHQPRVDEEAETDSRRDSPSLSVASSPASSIDLENSRGAEYRQSRKRSYQGYPIVTHNDLSMAIWLRK
ncbi:hypothetical protein LQW54_009182 [Pestalotiopsis sp. IQ-011]